MPWDERIGRRLKVKDLQTLMAVIDAGGIGKAADQLNITQPAVSKAIASLERTIGRRVLERGRKGIELTPYGEAMRNCGVAVLDELRKGVASLEFLSDPSSGVVRIGATEPVSAGILSAVVRRLSRQYPRLEFEVVVGNTTAVQRELKARNVDFAIAQLVGHVEDDQMESEILFDEPVVIAAGAKHPLARKRRVELAELVHEPWILPEQTSFIRTVFANAFRAKALEIPATTIVSPSAYFRLMLVSGGHFLTVVPAVMVQAGLKQLALKILPVELLDNRRPVGIVTLKDRTVSPAAQLFIEQLRAAAKLVQ